MAIKLTSKDNVVPAGGNYPYGDVKDNPGDNTGTKVNKKLMADYFQFFERIMAVAGVTFNGVPENSANSWQYVTALINIIVAQATTLVNAEAATRAAADTSLGNTKLNRSGSQAMLGNLDMNSNVIYNLSTPSNSNDAARLAEVNTEAGARAAGDAAEAAARIAAVNAEASARIAADNLKANAANPAITGTINKDGASLPVCVWMGRIDGGGGAGIVFQSGISGVSFSDNTLADGILTHNLGTSNYIVDITSLNDGSDPAFIASLTVNSFNIQTKTAGGRSACHVAIFKL